MRGGRSRPARRSCMPRRRRNVIVEGRVKTPNFDATWAAAHTADQIRGAVAPAECDAAGGARRPCRLRRGIGPRHADLHHADAASDAHRHRRRARHAGIRPARDRARRRRRLRPEDVADAGICRAGLAGAPAAKLGRLDRGPAGKPDGRLSQPRSGHRARRRLRQGRQAHGAVGGHRRQCRRLFLLPDHLRGRAADGDGRAAGTL